MKILSTTKNINMIFQFIASIILLFLPISAMIAQNTVASSDKLKPFEGEWKLKDNVWKSKSNSVYSEDVNPNRSFVARAVSPENTILWEEDFDNGAWATLLWTYHKETGRVNHISNTTDNNIGIGVNSNYGQRKKAKYIYLTATLDAAIWGAELASGEGAGRIYIIEPTGPFEDDPNLTDKKFPGNPTKSYRSLHPLRVIGEVEHWQGHAPEQLNAMKEHLEKLKQLGIEAIED